MHWLGGWLRLLPQPLAGGSALGLRLPAKPALSLHAAQAEALPAGSTKQGVFVTGRLNDFELTGERGTKCPNLRCRARGWQGAGRQSWLVGRRAAAAAAGKARAKCCAWWQLACSDCLPPAPPLAPCSIGQADVKANVYVRFDFVYDK